jgi:hypothetical protein
MTTEKHVVSVSLGSSTRDVDMTIELLGERVHIQRRGTDGSLAGAERLIGELDGKVDAIGLGGLDLYLQWRGRRYYFREARTLAAAAKRTPVVCGAGLKDSLERRAVALLEPQVGWRGRRVLLSAAVDRFGMAEALAEHGAELRYGDLMFALGLPLPVHSAQLLDLIARGLGPLITQLPIAWLYPTGAKQTRPTHDERFAAHYRWAEVVAGDWHLIRRFAPERLDGLSILTNTTTKSDVAFLKEAGVARLFTTTPRFEGRSLATNLLEATLVALRGPHQTRQGFDALLDEMRYQPTEVVLN